ncbi:hypothetical protein F5051DRAFT_447410 [Lentinula edodes]|nr:hypothetical protein F5051DRAFT_447410 [Lentinula edodes]
MPIVRFAEMKKKSTDKDTATTLLALKGKIYVDHLLLWAEQRAEICKIYESSGAISIEYSADDPTSQAAAHLKLVELELDNKSQEALES